MIPGTCCHQEIEITLLNTLLSCTAVYYMSAFTHFEHIKDFNKV